jgi:lysozyme family protein
MAETRFDICLAAVLREEGGFSDHPADPGGATNMGITRRTLADWRGVSPWQSLDVAAVKALTREEAARIYRARYWDACAADHLPAGLDLAVFDFAVNSGPVRAVRTLQELVGTDGDGIVGPRTLAAVRDRAQRGGMRLLIGLYCDRRLAFLESLATFAVFGRGWSRRVDTIRAASLEAAGPITTSTGRPTMDILNGYRTYVVAALMLLAGIAQVLGIEVPNLDAGSAGQLILEALAVIFLRRSLKPTVAKV